MVCSCNGGVEIAQEFGVDVWGNESRNSGEFRRFSVFVTFTEKAIFIVCVSLNNQDCRS